MLVRFFTIFVAGVISGTATADLLNTLPNSVPPVESKPKPEPKKKERAPKSPANSTAANKKDGTGVWDSDFSQHNANAPVYFTGNTANGSRRTGILNLLGAVTITQDDTKLTSNSAQIIATPGEMSLGSSSAVKKAIAMGDVHVYKKASGTSANITATADKIEFLVPSRTMILSGHTKIWKGKEFINADKMELDLNTGDIKLQAPQGTVNPQALNESHTIKE